MVRHKGKKIIKFKLKSNVSENGNNKQFTIRITGNLVKKCWKSTSGGPITIIILIKVVIEVIEII